MSHPDRTPGSPMALTFYQDSNSTKDLTDNAARSKRKSPCFSPVQTIVPMFETLTPESKCGTSGIFHSWRIFRIRNVEVTKCGSHFSNIVYFPCFFSFWPTLGAHDGLESIFKQQGRQIRLRNGRETNEKRFCETDMGQMIWLL